MHRLRRDRARRGAREIVVAPSANCDQLAEAKALRPWAADQELPIIGIGDYNFDFDFPTRRGNRAFGEFHLDYVW